MENFHEITFHFVVWYKALMKKLLGILIFTLFTGSAFAITCPADRNDYFCITPEMAPNSPIKLTDFYTIPARIMGLFSKELQTTGYPLMLDAQWESPFFGAGVSFYNEQFRMMILGGTTRIQGMSLDAYAAVVCHEMGHILGGAPHQTITGAEWSSSEGQSDFFAASVCLPRYYKAIGELEHNIAKRVEKAGFEMMNSMKEFDSNSVGQGRKLVRHAVNVTVVNETLINNYPSIQCRYETFRNPAKRASCWYKE
ncbi:hypothetical protein DOM21_06940 [Bacteriovorax stolpii]|uniref:Uncharacterized protein n=2 Tax=Bacteriovorax stolpii TaxID=960 RepID=A0A2K9NTG4_BACTC|nr:hypothetical protein C0V70_12005 [Bacteriovorax stolpii]QDK41194.1 hypothetical protein DOM21_06940 [Bacteriovorax stolpii]